MQAPATVSPRGDYAQRPIEFKSQHRLRGHFDRAAFGEDLRESAGPCAGSRTDGRALPTSRDSTDDGADGGAATGVFSGPLIRAHACFALPDEIGGAELIHAPVNRD